MVIRTDITIESVLSRYHLFGAQDAEDMLLFMKKTM